jgi:hypothetical protein
MPDAARSPSNKGDAIGKRLCFGCHEGSRP